MGTPDYSAVIKPALKDPDPITDSGCWRGEINLK
jgi:hypothetical protein